MIGTVGAVSGARALRISATRSPAWTRTPTRSRRGEAGIRLFLACVWIVSVHVGAVICGDLSFSATVKLD